MANFPQGRGRARAREARAVARAGTWTGAMHARTHKYHVRASKRGVPRAPRGERVGNVCTYRLELSFVLLRQLVDERRDHAAGPAPGRPEVHEDGDVALEHLRLEGGVGHDGGGACLGSRGERGGQTTDGTEREKDADATAIAAEIAASVRVGTPRRYARDTRRETRRWRRNRDATRNAPLPLVTSALHTRPERAGARAGARALSCTRDLRERATFALRAVTWEVTADMVLACGRT